MTCMHDNNEQCFEDCPRCPRYKVHFECCNCGGRDEALYNTDKGIYCKSCLSDLINKSENKELKNDIISEFILHYHAEFEEFLEEWFECGKVCESC